MDLGDDGYYEIIHTSLGWFYGYYAWALESVCLVVSMMHVGTGILSNTRLVISSVPAPFPIFLTSARGCWNCQVYVLVITACSRKSPQNTIGGCEHRNTTIVTYEGLYCLCRTKSRLWEESVYRGVCTYIAACYRLLRVT